jgi:hypothetical protein
VFSNAFRGLRVRRQESCQKRQGYVYVDVFMKLIVNRALTWKILPRHPFHLSFVDEAEVGAEPGAEDVVGVEGEDVPQLYRSEGHH